MVFTGLLIFVLVTMHAFGVADLRVSPLSQAALSIVCIVFATAVTLFFTARKICNSRTKTADSETASGSEAGYSGQPKAGQSATGQPDTEYGHYATGQTEFETGQSATVQPEFETGRYATVQPDTATGQSERAYTEAEPFVPEEDRIFDKTLTLELISGNLAAYAAENGLAISREFAKKIIASMCSSRLVAVAGADENTVERLTEILNGFFGSTAEQTLKDTLLYAYKSGGKVVVANLRQSDGAQTISTFAARALSPKRKSKISFGGGTYSNIFYNIPPNVWTFTALTEGITKQFADAAAFVDFEKGVSENVEKCSAVGYYQLIKSAELSLNTDLPDEDGFWKKCDKLEKFIAETKGYIGGNKKIRAIEAFASAYSACGGENVLGATAAAHYAAPARVSGITVEQFVGAVDEIFGEDSAAVCKKIADAVTGD